MEQTAVLHNPGLERQEHGHRRDAVLREQEWHTTPPDHSRKTTNVTSLLAGWNVTQSHLLWDVAPAKDQAGAADCSTRSSNSRSAHREGFQEWVYQEL